MHRDFDWWSRGRLASAGDRLACRGGGAAGGHVHGAGGRGEGKRWRARSRSAGCALPRDRSRPGRRGGRGRGGFPRCGAGGALCGGDSGGRADGAGSDGVARGRGSRCRVRRGAACGGGRGVVGGGLGGVARGGQVVASAVVRELAGADPALHFGAGREVGLPGLSGRIVVHEVRWGGQRRRLRVVIADDAALVRDGVAALLRDNDVEVLAAVADAGELHEAVARHVPAVARIDIRMPPAVTERGLGAAERIRVGFPEVGVLVLSQHLDARYAVRVAGASPARTGYLLKDRVTDSHVLFDALERIAAGGCVIDTAVAEGLMARASALARIDELTEREREVLALVAEGLSNRAIAEKLVVTQKTVETHIGQIFLKLGLRDVEGEDRRVVAVLTYLRAGHPGSAQSAGQHP